MNTREGCETAILVMRLPAALKLGGGGGAAVVKALAACLVSGVDFEASGLYDVISALSVKCPDNLATSCGRWAMMRSNTTRLRCLTVDYGHFRCTSSCSRSQWSVSCSIDSV